MRHVVACISKDATAVCSDGSVPVPEDDSMGDVPKWRCQGREQRRRHHKAVLVHRKVVVDTVKDEVEGDCDTVVWKVAAWC
jgi:hypothetical protein